MEHTPKYAGFWIRFVGEILDSILLSIASWLLEFGLLYPCYWVWAFFQARSGVTVPPFSEVFNAFFLQIVNTGLYLVISFPYYVWGHYKYGTTLGKKPLKIYVVSAKDDQPITLKQSILRYFGYGASYIILMTGFLMAAFHPRKQALHDLIAGTISIRR